MKRNVYLILLFVLTIVVSAQDTNTYDTTEILRKAKSDSDKVKVYIEYSGFVKNTNPESAIEYAMKAIKLARTSGSKEILADAYSNLANIYFDKHNYPLSLENLFKSLDLFKEINNKKKVAYTYNLMGIIFSRQANYELAMDYYLKSLKIRKNIKDKKGISGSYNNIGNLFNNQGNYEKALEYHFNCLEIKKEIDDKRGLAISYNNIGEIYRLQDSLGKAIKYYSKSLEINRQLGNPDGISTVLLNLGIIALNKEEYAKSLDYFNRSLEISKKIHDKYKIADLHNYLGEYYFKTNNINKSIQYYKSAYKIGMEIGTPQIASNAAKGLSSIYNNINNYQQAYNYHKLFKQISDSIHNYTAIKKFTQQEMQHKFNQILKEKEFERKQAEIKQEAKIRKQRILIYAFVIGTILLIIIAFAVIRNNRIKQKANIALQQSNAEINQQKEEILTQHNHLEKLNKELKKKNEEITNQRNNLEKLNFELFEQKEAITEEKKLSDMLVKNILPDIIADELINKKKIKPHYYKLATVIFTDFKDFTALSKELSLLDLVNELDTHFAEFDGIIEKHNIEKIKTIGDAYLAVGGIPLENKSNPISVVLAGLEIQRYAERINRLQRKLKFPLWELRIGIHTGEVFTGVVGKKKFAFEVLGESVFVASRIEDFCEVGKVTISQATYDQVKDYFECTYAQTVDLKNQYPMMIYTVQSIKPGYSIKNEGKVPNNKLFRIIKDLSA